MHFAMPQQIFFFNVIIDRRYKSLFNSFWFGQKEHNVLLLYRAYYVTVHRRNSVHISVRERYQQALSYTERLGYHGYIHEEMEVSRGHATPKPHDYQ